MMIEKRTLTIGMEFNGEIHRELEVGPRKVKHLIAASADPLFEADKHAYEVCCLAAQIVKLGDIPKAEITGALLAEMDADDFDMLTEAAETVRQRTRSFRGGAGEQSAGSIGSDEAGLQPG